MPVFILDSNFFIQAHRTTYPIDVATGFWNKVKDLAARGSLISLDKVRNEIYGGNDALEDWCKENLPEGYQKAVTI
jgi:hypothetical protein